MKLPSKINLGCGKDIKPGYMNVDSVKLPGVDVVHNLDEYPWPFSNNSFDEVYCSHVLEHLSSIIKPMEEIWRISKPKAKVAILVPIFPGIDAAADPTHKKFFTYTTFNYFRPEDALRYYSKARFRILKRKIFFSSYTQPFTWFFNLSGAMQRFYYTFLSFLIPAQMIYFELEAVKQN